MAPEELEPIDGKQNPNYLFSSGGFAATARLNFQHCLWVQQTGHQISPAVSIKEENLLIADLGAGTGIWLINLSHQVPASATLHGFDIKNDLGPRAEWLPPNISFHELNVFEPVPEQFVGKYDIVNIRLFAPVVQEGDPKPVIECALKLLKPGGILQWEERDLKPKKVGEDRTGAMEILADSIRNLRKSLFRYGRIVLDWVPNLNKEFEACGLEVIEFERHPVLRQMFGPNMDLLFVTANEASYGLDRMVSTEAGDANREEIRNAFKEYREHGTVIDMGDIVVCVGRKPGKT